MAEMEQLKREASLKIEREIWMLEERLTKEGEKVRETEEEGFDDAIAANLTKKRQHELYEHRRREGTDPISHERRDAVALPQGGKLPSKNDRIKFIRISHVMVGHNPFRIRNILMNIRWSQVSRFELMGEMLLEESTTVDTIVLRPGQITDEARNTNTTSLQLSVDGLVPSPSLVGRDDVADLAVVLALTKTSSPNTLQPDSDTSGSLLPRYKEILPNELAHHWTWAMRWTGQYLSPPQGLRPDGYINAAMCFVMAVKEQILRDKKRLSNMEKIESYYGGTGLLQLIRWSRKLKPYAQSLAVLLSVYLTLGIVFSYLFGQTFVELFSRVRRSNIHRNL